MSLAAYRRPPRRRRSRLPALATLLALSAAGWAVLTRPHGDGPAVRDPGPAPVAGMAGPAPRSASQSASNPAPGTSLAWMLDPRPALGPGGGGFRPPPAAAPAPARPAAVAEAGDAAPPQAPARTPAAAPEPARLAALAPAAPPPALVPLPVARPAEFQRTPPPLEAAPAARLAARRLPRTREVFRAAIAEEPSFFERLFGAERAAPGQALAYADPDAMAAPRPRLPSVAASVGTAVYDISAGTVTMPGGAVLEAHSGYGDLMDDPRYVHVRMRGATPPGTYDLSERGALFHGVRAIRLTPVGGSGAIHGRDGILAHTYMLRQPGASNGCVVFRDYPRFLGAFLRGEVQRMVVVAGGRGGARLADRSGG